MAAGKHEMCSLLKYLITFDNRKFRFCPRAPVDKGIAIVFSLLRIH